MKFQFLKRVSYHWKCVLILASGACLKMLWWSHFYEIRNSGCRNRFCRFFYIGIECPKSQICFEFFASVFRGFRPFKMICFDFCVHYVKELPKIHIISKFHENLLKGFRFITVQILPILRMAVTSAILGFRTQGLHFYQFWDDGHLFFALLKNRIFFESLFEFPENLTILL